MRSLLGACFIACFRVISASSLVPVHDAIVRGDVAALTSLLVVDKKLATALSADGKGPAWWVMENGGDDRMVGLLLALGADILTNKTDKEGRTPLQLLTAKKLTTEIVSAWDTERHNAQHAVTSLQLLLIKHLERELGARKALSDELDSYDE